MSFLAAFEGTDFFGFALTNNAGREGFLQAGRTTPGQQLFFDGKRACFRSALPRHGKIGTS